MAVSQYSSFLPGCSENMFVYLYTTTLKVIVVKDLQIWNYQKCVGRSSVLILEALVDNYLFCEALNSNFSVTEDEVSSKY